MFFKLIILKVQCLIYLHFFSFLKFLGNAISILVFGGLFFSFGNFQTEIDLFHTQKNHHMYNQNENSAAEMTRQRTKMPN